MHDDGRTDTRTDESSPQVAEDRLHKSRSKTDGPLRERRHTKQTQSRRGQGCKHLLVAKNGHTWQRIEDGSEGPRLMHRQTLGSRGARSMMSDSAGSAPSDSDGGMSAAQAGTRVTTQGSQQSSGSRKEHGCAVGDARRKAHTNRRARSRDLQLHEHAPAHTWTDPQLSRTSENKRGERAHRRCWPRGSSWAASAPAGSPAAPPA